MLTSRARRRPTWSQTGRRRPYSWCIRSCRLRQGLCRGRYYCEAQSLPSNPLSTGECTLQIVEFVKLGSVALLVCSSKSCASSVRRSQQAWLRRRHKPRQRGCARGASSSPRVQPGGRRHAFGGGAQPLARRKSSLHHQQPRQRRRNCNATRRQRIFIFAGHPSDALPPQDSAPPSPPPRPALSARPAASTMSSRAFRISNPLPSSLKSNVYPVVLPAVVTPR